MTLESIGPIGAKNKGRVKFLEIDPDLILSLVSVPIEGRRMGDQLIKPVGESIPCDASVVRCGISECGNVLLTILSNKFEEVIEGAIVPRLCPQFRSKLIVEKESPDGQ